ncbi:MAG: carbamoyl-phosphate synthase large subunit, partial [Nitrospinaceae bacterium]
PHWDRLWHIAAGLRRGLSVEEVYKITAVDPWFLFNIKEIVDFEREIIQTGFLDKLSDGDLRKAKQMGYSDLFLAKLLNCKETEVNARRQSANIVPVFKRVDTCGAEFEAHTPYLYSTYEEECEANPSDKKKIMILGGGPNRIGQGIEFDYCCVHASFALREENFETIMVNCNPETVSTDYDTSDRLYFEPLTYEDVLHIVQKEKPDGVIVQFGGQTPLRLAIALEQAGVPIIGTSPDNIDRAEDRKRFKEVLEKLGIRQPKNGTATSLEEARTIAEEIGYPVMVRPSYVLGGRAMEIVYNQDSLDRYMRFAVKASPEHPVLIDDFLDNATELDVDAISDGQQVVIGGVMEHIEEAGVHSGDSACSLPPFTIPLAIVDEIKQQTRELARELNVIGLLNIQFAVRDGEIFVLEVNPRASRTVPFVSKAIGVPLAKLAAKVMAGKTLSELGFTEEREISHIAVKESVFPFIKFSDVDILLGPEMKSTGEVMGLDTSFGRAFAKSQIATGIKLPPQGMVFISVKEGDKSAVGKIGKSLVELGYQLMATRGTGDYLRNLGLEVAHINKVKEGSPHIVETLEAGKVDFMINTTFGEQAVKDSFSMRRASLTQNLPYCTTIPGAFALVDALQSLKTSSLSLSPLQEYWKNEIQTT